VIVAAGTTLGLAWNGLSGRGFELSSNVFIQEGDEIIDIVEAKTRFENGALFLDARPTVFWQMGHISGARPLPEDDFESFFAELEPALREHFLIVVYCSGLGCESSHIVARELRARGIHAAVLHEGLPAWEDAGYPIEQGNL
jgi:rhodanese-related sulfurtransferase